MLHYLDIMDAKMYDMEEAISKTKPGEFSDRIWSMDNRTIYRATFGSDRTKVPKESVASGELTESTEPEDESVEMQQVLWNL